MNWFKGWWSKKWTWARENLLYILFAVVLLMTACGHRAPGEASLPPEPAPIPSPEPPPAPITTDVRMAYGYWGVWSFDQPLMPYPSLAVSNKSDWSKGKITFGLTGFSKADIPFGPYNDFIPFMAKFKGMPGGPKLEANFHYNIADWMPRFVEQRFDGPTSDGRDFFEKQIMIDSPHTVFEWRADEAYWFTFEWDSTWGEPGDGGQIRFSVGDSHGAIHAGSLPMHGYYTGVEWIRVGNGVLWPYPGLQVDVVVINPVLE